LAVSDYDAAAIKEKLKKAIDQHFPLERFFSPSDAILLKPNLLMPATPDQAVVTHPVLVQAVAGIFQDFGCPVSVGDSPGGFVDRKAMEDVYGQSGYFALRQAGVQLLNPDQSVEREGLPFCWWAAGGYKLVSLPKIKTHELMTLTLAVKNMYGCISGAQKSKLHVDYLRPIDFVEMLLKVYRLARPAFSICDGILAMEGPGPSLRGFPRHLGVVVLGDDALYVDLAISRLLGVSDARHILIRRAKELGLVQEDQLEMISEVPVPLVKDYKLPRQLGLDRIPAAVFEPLKALLKFYPVVTDRCTACGACIQVCPRKTITMKGKRALIHKERCIRCLCCAEMCRFGAIELEKNLLLKMASAAAKLIRGK